MRDRQGVEVQTLDWIENRTVANCVMIIVVSINSYKGCTMFVKGIKRGRNIEIFEDLNIPDGQEILIIIETRGSFWKSLNSFRQELDTERIWLEPEVFEGVRDSSSGREVIL